MKHFTPQIRLRDLSFRGLGPATLDRLEKRGLVRVEDVLYFFPLRYDDMTNRKRLRDVKPGEKVTVHVRVKSRRQRSSYPRRIPMTEVVTSDESGSLFVVWFNQPYLAGTIKTGMELMLFGKAEIGRKGLTMTNPTYQILSPDEMLHAASQIVPVYPAVERVSNRFLTGLVGHCINGSLPCNFQVPEELVHTRGFPDKRTCFSRIHFPETSAQLRQIESFGSIFQQALVYEDLFVFFAGVEAVRRLNVAVAKPVVDISTSELEQMKGLLPFQLTSEQDRVLTEIFSEYAAGKRLARLVQGDVGSGKTVVGLLAALPFLRRNGQCAFMAPTEILAVQHYQTLRDLLSGSDIRVRLLIGGARAAERREILSNLADGQIQLLVGTHALIQDDVRFHNLQITIIDEQHRFGVDQREALVRKGDQPHILSLTATPIPRTLAMTLYGQYDYDVIRSKPAGRKPVRTIVKKEENSGEVYRFVHDSVCRHKMQAYFVYPLIEESEVLDVSSATRRYEELKRDWFSRQRTALVHGRMKNEERSRIMDMFKSGEVDILFSTTVIEVGVDVANANIMVIENAERFGLSQLHQLRGRIGRGDAQAYCFLVVSEIKGENAFRRLKIMARTGDGFEIAEEDLKIRGPGEFLGTRQSGVPEFRVADIFRDRDMVELAKSDAKSIVEAGQLDFLDTREWQKRFGRSLV